MVEPEIWRLHQLQEDIKPLLKIKEIVHRFQGFLLEYDGETWYLDLFGPDASVSGGSLEEVLNKIIHE